MPKIFLKLLALSVVFYVCFRVQQDCGAVAFDVNDLLFSFSPSS